MAIAPGETGVWLNSDAAGLWLAGVIARFGVRLSGLGASLRSPSLAPAAAPATAATPAAAAASGLGVLIRRGAGASARGIEPLGGAPALSAKGFSEALLWIGRPIFSSDNLRDGVTAA